MNLRTLVSQNKKRYQMHSFDLDLTYITDKVVAMGFPSESLESVYRNPMSEVQRFFETFHHEHYMVYNLCSERDYKEEKFHGRVERYPFDDHNCPTIELIENFCDSVEVWLHSHRSNVAAVHCKAGKGRTGLMITCWMLYSGLCETAQEALEFYAFVRCMDQKGVTIPSQIRFVEYIERLKVYGPVPHVSLALRSLIIHTVPKALTSKIRHHSLGFRVLVLLHGEKEMREIFSADAMHKTVVEVKGETREALIFQFPAHVLITGSVKMEFFYRDILGRPVTLFRFWFHCSFVGSSNQLLLKKVLVEFGDVAPGVQMEGVPPNHNDLPLGHLVHHYNREGLRMRGAVARMTGSQRLFAHKLRLLRHKALYQIGVLEATLEKDLKALMEVTDQEVAANPKRAQQVAVSGPLLARIRDYMRDMPPCKAYASPFAPAAHLDNSCRSLVRPLIKDGEEILSKLLKLKIVTQAATDMEGQLGLFLRYINGLAKWYDMGTEELHGKRRQDDLERDLDVLLYTKLSSSTSSSSSLSSASAASSSVVSPINSPPTSPRLHKPSSTSSSPRPPHHSTSAAAATAAPSATRSWVPADACEGKDLERVRAAVEDIRHATRAASLSPDARRARAIRASMTEKKRTVAPTAVWTGYATMRPSLGARGGANNATTNGAERSAENGGGGGANGPSIGRKPPKPDKPLPATPPSPRDELEADVAVTSSSPSPSSCHVKGVDEAAAAEERAMKRRNVRALDVRSAAEGDVKGASLAAFLIRSPPTARLSGLQLGSSRSTRCLRTLASSSSSTSAPNAKLLASTSADEPLVKASSSGVTSLRVRSPMWSRRRSVTINHLPGGGEADSGDWTVATGDDDGRRPRSKEEGEGLRCQIVIGSKKEHTTKTSTKKMKAKTKKKGLADDEDDEDDDEAEEGDEDKEEGEEEERRGSVYARFTMISQTIERVAHLVAAMQDQLALCEAMMEDLLPAASPSSSPSPSPSPSSSSSSSSSSSTSSPPWRAQVRSLPQHEKAAFLRRIRSVNAILYSAASTLGSVADTDRHHHDDQDGGGAGAWRRSGAWLSAGAGSDGRAEEERELLGRRQAALGLVASMRARLATFKQRLEDGLVDDAELTTEANRIGFVVEYLAHSLRQPS